MWDDSDGIVYDDYASPKPHESDALTVSELLETCNDLLRANLNNTVVEGEVAEYKLNQGKWVFFLLKDEESTISCFMPVWKLSTEITDGMKVRIVGAPKLTKWGKFSFTVEKIAPVGEGNIKKAFELLKKKLEKEGLFDPARKRPLPENPIKIGVISSTGAAGYADFCKIVNARWVGLDIQVCHTQVQGLDAPVQIIRALKYLNEQAEVEVIAIIRGGGSKDDLSCFNDELLAREIASSRIPVITGIGHEVDESIADLVADQRASTPSNCAEMLTQDKVAVHQATETKRLHIRSRLLSAMSDIYHHSRNNITTISSQLRNKANEIETARHDALERIGARLTSCISTYERETNTHLQNLKRLLHTKLDSTEQKLISIQKILESCNPETVLKQGYAILRGKVSPGEALEITTEKQLITAKITKITERSQK